jgi:uncharacterized protein
MTAPIPPVEQVIVIVTEWAARNSAVRGVLLVGSQARGEAKLNSDVDLMLLVDDPGRFRSDVDWLSDIEWSRAGACPVARQDASYGVAWSRHVRLDKSLEVEFTFAPISWADSSRIDAGTRRVVKDGCRILYDPDAMLSALIMQVAHAANRDRWNVGAESWAHRADTRGIWRKAHLDPSLALHPAELGWLRDCAGKRVAVLGSGDNQVVFALAGLGANLTSIDISEQQIEVARQRAASLGLQVDFVQADVVDLVGLPDATFDIVYTGGHVAVWVADLQRHYAEAARILKPGGLLIVSEYHPFRRVWRRSPINLELRFNYFDRGPHRSEAAPDVLSGEHGEWEQFLFRWTVADYITAILASGCQLVHAEEFGDTSEEWEGAPMTGLPGSLLLVGRRNE